jgi:hypothetical protein
MVSLLDGGQTFVVKSAAGFVPPGTMLTPPGICHWSLVPQIHQMVVIEDTLLDARCARHGQPRLHAAMHRMQAHQCVSGDALPEAGRG